MGIASCQVPGSQWVDKYWRKRWRNNKRPLKNLQGKVRPPVAPAAAETANSGRSRPPGCYIPPNGLINYVLHMLYHGGCNDETVAVRYGAADDRFASAIQRPQSMPID